jgi:hypothetical protein
VNAGIRSWAAQAAMRAARWLCGPVAMLAVGVGALSAPAATSTATSHLALLLAPALLLAFGALRDWPLVWLGVLLIVLILCYGIGMLAASRRDPRRLAAIRPRPILAGSPGPAPPDDLFFVFLLPGLNDLPHHLSSPAIRGDRPLTAAVAQWRTPCQPRSPPGTPRLDLATALSPCLREHSARVANPRRFVSACDKV